MKCEACNTGGWTPQQCVADASKEMILGPCCFIRPMQSEPIDLSKVQYGLELSSNLGFSLYAEYGGMKLEYRKTNEEVRKFFNDLRTPERVPAAQMLITPMEGNC